MRKCCFLHTKFNKNGIKDIAKGFLMLRVKQSKNMFINTKNICYRIV